MKSFAGTLGLLASLGSPARALAQTSDDAGASAWNLPDEAAPPQAPAELPPPPEPAAPPPPAESPAPREVEQPPPSGPRFPVTFSSEAALMTIRGPGMEKPFVCTGTCTFPLWEGIYWIDIQASGRTWTTSVTVTQPERVVLGVPNASVRTLGVAAIIVGGSVVGIAGLVAWNTVIDCQTGGAWAGGPHCDSKEKALPYWLAAGGVSALATVVGIGLVVINSNPSVEVLPALGNRALREPGTLVGLGPVEGSTLPGLTLRVSF